MTEIFTGGDALLGYSLARKQLLGKRFLYPLLCVQGTVRAEPKGLLTRVSHSSFMMKKKESEMPGGDQLPGKQSGMVSPFSFFCNPINLLPS